MPASSGTSAHTPTSSLRVRVALRSLTCHTEDASPPRTPACARSGRPPLPPSSQKPGLHLRGPATGEQTGWHSARPRGSASVPCRAPAPPPRRPSPRAALPHCRRLPLLHRRGDAAGVRMRASAWPCCSLGGDQECDHAVCDSRGLGSGGSHGCFPGARGSAASRTVLASGCRLLPALGTVRCALIGDASGVSPPSLPEVSAEAPMPQHGPRRVPHPPAQGIPALSPAVPAPERLGDLPKSATSLFLVTGFLVRMSSSGATAAPRPGVPVSAPALPPGPPAWGWAPH